MNRLLPLSLPGLQLFAQNIPLAIALVVLASFLFAGGATVQHLAVDGTVEKAAENPSMSLRQVFSLLQNRRWLSGLAMVATGASIHIVGLMLAPVTVVQPVGILAVPWSVLLAARLHGFRPTKAIWGAVGLTILGIVSFTLISAHTAAPDTNLPEVRIVVACLLIYACGGLLGFLGQRGSAARRCLMWASGGSFFYGLSSALIKTITEFVRAGGFLARPVFWVVAVLLLGCYLLGGWMIQQGYANGPAEIVVGSMTTTDPIIAVTFGMAVLGGGCSTGVAGCRRHGAERSGGCGRRRAAVALPPRGAGSAGVAVGRSADLSRSADRSVPSAGQRPLGPCAYRAMAVR